MKMSKPLALALVLVFLTASSTILAMPVSGTSASENTWTTEAPMPTARGYLDTAVIKAKYMLLEEVDRFGTNEEYDPATDNWTTKSPCPLPNRVLPYSFRDKIYCIGGLPYGNTGVNQVYDPATDTWTTKTPMPTPRYGLQANVVDGKIYLMGGVKLNEGYDQVSSC